jgi:heterodisulfide reductase subunit C
MIATIIFIACFAAAVFLFSRNVSRVSRNIKLGRDLDRSDRPAERWAVMARVALGQSKMMVRPVAGLLHILIYVGFVIINIEVLEIIIDGIAGTHRVFGFMGGLYDFLIGSFEFLALGVLLACVVFLIRRNIIRLPRFHKPELKGFPVKDANLILITEILLMTAFLVMNGADYVLQGRGAEHYIQAGAFPVSSLLAPLFSGFGDSTLIFMERSAWWFHILGILAFLNYLPYSKHFHILLAFPNTYYSNLEPKGKFKNDENVQREVQLMMDPNADPYAAPPADAVPVSFGAKDVTDLTWKNLMDAYSCTECGRCTSECPANQTGKKLSPRKIMMDTRDRLEEVGRGIDASGKEYKDGRMLLGDYITEEEIWACTTCNACVEACPVNIDPLNIIMQLRNSLVMEDSKAPAALMTMFSNIENNAAPWQFAQADRLNWRDEA